MVSPKQTTPSANYVDARSRTPSPESSSGNRGASVAPLSGDGSRAICLSNSTKRLFKDRHIYVNKRTGLPVRPPTSFGLFKHALRRTIKDDRVSFSDFNKLASEKWAALNDTDKSLYAQRARDLAAQYKKVEVRFLRKKVRQLQTQFREIRKVSAGYNRRR